MSFQCHLLVNFKLTDPVHDHKGKTREKRVVLLLLVEWLFLESFKVEIVNITKNHQSWTYFIASVCYG